MMNNMQKVVNMLIHRYGKDRPLTLEHLRITLDITDTLDKVTEVAKDRAIAEQLDLWEDNQSPGWKRSD